MTKQELAAQAGVTVRTLMKWSNRYKKELKRMGVEGRTKILPPPAVKFLSEMLDIDINEC
ncbi:MAG: hypothetical protein K5896_09420 [Prevotella sp.]|nr:hypothetical protein [Prevotella sp.]